MFFSDAVVAIALTLLVLPLAEVATEAADKYPDSHHLFADNQAKIYSFVLSFAVIARIWTAHHRLFEQIKAYNRRLMRANLGWLLAIVVLPFPTELIGQFDHDRLNAAFYIGTVLAANAFLFAMIMIVRAEPGLAEDGAGIPGEQLFTSGVTLGLLAAALVVAVAVPAIGYFALMFLVLTYPIIWIRQRLHPAEVTA
ncbi:TMEM175 family protein [Actinomadura sp. DC4]|nr:TMEM175 family protein [Actinomadura sp. DC4]